MSELPKETSIREVLRLYSEPKEKPISQPEYQKEKMNYTLDQIKNLARRQQSGTREGKPTLMYFLCRDILELRAMLTVQGIDPLMNPDPDSRVGAMR